MSIQKLFSIFFTSFWLLVHYVRGLKEKRDDTGALRELFAAFWNSPRLLSVNQIEHYSGHCYVITLDKTYLNDIHGRSSLVLLENNQNLQFPHTLNLQDIVEKGAGRYRHNDNKIFFSPSDNTDLTRSNTHHYQILECLDDDINTIHELMDLNKKHEALNHPTLFLIEKLRIYLKNNFTFLEQIDKFNGIQLESVKLDLSEWLLGIWTCNSTEIYCRQEKTEKLWHIKLTNVKINGINANFSLNIELIQTQHYALRLNSFNLKIDQKDYLYVNTQLNNDIYQSIKIQFYFTTSWANLLMQSVGVGGDEMQYRNWLSQFIETLSSGTLGYKYKISEDHSNKIQSAFSPGTSVNDLYIDVENLHDSFEIKNVWSELPTSSLI